MIKQLTESPFSSADIVVDFSLNIIVKGDVTYTLQPKVIELLVLLCSVEGETLSKQSIIESLWPDTIVGPDSLSNSMARLRKALGDDAKNPKYVQTIQRKGYRWLQPVNLIHNKPKSLLKNRKSIYSALIALSCFIAIVVTTHLKEEERETFPFPDLSIKKLPDGGYEIQAGIEGKLTEEKKAILLKEIKRITGEEYSGMEFTIDTDIPICFEKDGASMKCETK